MKNIKILLPFLALLSVIVPADLQARDRNTVVVSAGDSEEEVARKAAGLCPSCNQLTAMRDEFIAFIHFGPNTFSRREWGTGMEDPAMFALRSLDTDQWCEAMRAAGMKKVLLTVKHHDGFVLWQSRYTRHGVMSSPFEDGHGDILKSLSASCRKYGLKLGIYLSPADLYQIESPDGLYGNGSSYTERVIPRTVPGRPFQNKTKFRFLVDDYNEYFLNQLFELLTEYGPIHEVWFDGAHPKRKGGQRYNYAAWKKLIRKLAPKAVIFGREDIRWCGNEAGRTRSTEWNVVSYPFNPDTASVFHDMTAEDLGSRSALAAAKYLHYQPAETNTSIRDGWFYRDDNRQQVRSADDVFDIYERSVGGNSVFLLNIPPNRDGRFSDTDVKVLHEVGRRIRETYSRNLLAGSRGLAKLLDGDDHTGISVTQPIVVELEHPVQINRVVVQEDVSRHGERVEAHALDVRIDGQWKEVARATNIGYKRILRFPTVTTDAVRLRILASRLTPVVSTLSAHYYIAPPPSLRCSRTADGLVTIVPQKGGDVLDSKIYYTIDGSAPTAATGQLYTSPFHMSAGRLQAVAISGDKVGALLQEQFGFVKTNWQLLSCTSETAEAPARNVFDGDVRTGWQASGELPQSVSIDLGSEQTLKGMACTPLAGKAGAMASEGRILISHDGKAWDEVAAFSFGNLINDPTRRFLYFTTPVGGRYVRLEAAATAGGQTLAIAELDFF